MSLCLFSDILQNSKEISIERSQRSIFVTFDKVGIDQNSIDIPFMDCMQNCEEIENWNIPVKNYFLTETKEDNEYYLLEKEFDVINIANNMFQFEIGESVYSEKYRNIEFSDEVSKFQDFEANISKHINSSEFQKSLKSILSKSLFERLILKQTKPISQNLKLELLKKSYLIAFYVENLEGEFRAIKSRKDNGFNLITDVDLILKAIIYKYDPKTEKLVKFKTFSGESISIDITRNIKELYSINYFDSEYSYFPNRSDGIEQFQIAFQKSFEEAYRKIVDQMDRLDLFQNFSPITAIQKEFVKFNQINRKEFLRVDAPIYLQNIDLNGTSHNIAWGKIREVGKR